MVRLAVVGIGGYGWGLVQAIERVSETAGCRLVAAADARLAALPERAEELSKSGAELFGDALAMLDALRGKCDAIYVATGIATHEPLTVAALDAGYHVHVEKPPAATIQELDRMAAAAERAGRICLVGFQALHGADIGFVKERVVSGRIGAVKSLACQAGWPRNRAYYARNDWAGRLKVGDAWVLDGPATNALAHQVANMLYLGSPEPLRLAVPTAVRAELYAAGPAESHDTAAIEIRTREGATAYWIGSHCSQATFGPVIDIEAERARVVWSMGGGATVTYEDGSQEVCPGDREGGQSRMVADFVAAIRAGDASGLAGRVADVRPFVLAVDGAHESSGRIHRIGAAHSHRVAEGTDEARTVVARIDEAIACAAEERRLFSDLADAPRWAVPTQPFDLAGYSAFPARFAPASS